MSLHRVFSLTMHTPSSGDARRRAVTALLGGTVAVALLAACGTDTGGDPISAPEPTTTATAPSPSPSPSLKPTPIASDDPVDGPTPGTPAFPVDTAPQLERGSGRLVVLRDVRVADHGSFDRIVLEFSGTGTPGWSVNYVDEAVLEGSGKIVGLGGDATLDLFASNTTWPADDYYSGPTQFAPRDGGDVSDVYVAGTFEGYTQVLAGIDGDPAPFRIFTRTGPPRLVVDVAHDSVD